MARKLTKRTSLLGMVLVLMARLAIQVLVYRAGFEAFTADDFGRTVSAAVWAQKPYVHWCGVWLPFQMYLYGMALRLVWELEWVPRAFGIVWGLIGVVLMYRLSVAVFGSRVAGLLSALFMAVNPIHIWLSLTSLTETPHVALVVASLFSFATFLKNKRYVFAYLSAMALAVANGQRFDAWVISGVFSLYSAGEGVLHVLRRRTWSRHTSHLIVASVLPWVFPIIWVLSCYIRTGNPLFSMVSIMSYKAQYGTTKALLPYWRALVEIDPYLVFLAPIALVMCWLRRRGSRLTIWFVVMAVVPFLIFMVFLGGQRDPRVNRLRYLASFVFLTYPASAALLWWAVSRLVRLRWLRYSLLVAAVSGIAVTQVRAAFRFTNDPAAEGLAVGQRIRAMRQESPESAHPPVMIQMSHWAYLAIHVGANDLSLIVYDRETGPAHQLPESLLLTDLDAVRTCIAAHDIGYIVVKAPELKEAVEQGLGLSPVDEVNAYAFYLTPAEMRDAEIGKAVCPLVVGWHR